MTTPICCNLLLSGRQRTDTNSKGVKTLPRKTQVRNYCGGKIKRSDSSYLSNVFIAHARAEIPERQRCTRGKTSQDITRLSVTAIASDASWSETAPRYAIGSENEMTEKCVEL